MFAEKIASVGFCCASKHMFLSRRQRAKSASLFYGCKPHPEPARDQLPGGDKQTVTPVDGHHLAAALYGAYNGACHIFGFTTVHEIPLTFQKVTN